MKQHQKKNLFSFCRFSRKLYNNSTIQLNFYSFSCTTKWSIFFHYLVRIHESLTIHMRPREKEHGSGKVWMKKKLSSSEKSNLIHFIKMKNSYWSSAFELTEKRRQSEKRNERRKKGKELFLWEVAKLKEIFFSFIIIFIHNIISFFP